MLAVSSTSLSVAGVTCAVPTAMANAVTTTFQVGNRAEISCAWDGTQLNLTKAERKALKRRRMSDDENDDWWERGD